MLELVGEKRKSNVVADIVRDRNALVIIVGKENIVLPSGTHMYRIPNVKNLYGRLWGYLSDCIEQIGRELEFIRYVIVYTNNEENLDFYRKWLKDFEEHLESLKGYSDGKIYILAYKG